MDRKVLVSLLAVALLVIMPIACVESEASEIATGDSEDIGGNCTGFYVGKKVSAEGTTLIGQTDDSKFANISYHTYPEVTEKGRKIYGNEGFVYDIPEHTYSYTVFSSHRDDGENSSGTGGINSQGLAYTGSITASASDAAIKADPYEKGGINEDCIGKLISMSCDSARSAVEFLCKIIKEKGSHESAIFILADQEEAWYFEVYTGHQYLAIRLPEDKMATFGNEYSIMHVNEGVEYIASPGLKSLADEKGFAVYDDGAEHTIDNLRIKDTYSAANRESCHLRTWRGHNLYDVNDPGDYSDSAHYQLLFTPKSSITVKNMMDFLRDRCEGTKYCPEETGRVTRVIGVEFTLEAHVLQIHDDLPKEMCVTYWGCAAPPEFGVYLPFNNLITEFHEAFGEIGESTVADSNTMYGVTKQIHGICLHSKSLMKEGVRQYWDDLENYYLTIYPQVLAKASELLSQSKGAAERYITDYSIGIQASAFEDANLIRDYCIQYLSVNATTTKVMNKMYAVVDVVKYSERYGWTSEVKDGIVTLTHGDYTMVIEDTSTNQKSCCKVTFGEKVYENVPLFKWGDSFCLPMNIVSGTLSSFDPVIVFHSEKADTGSSDNTVTIIATAIIAILAIIGVAVFARRT